MSGIVILEWSFSPPDYFEEVIQISCHDYDMTISLGKVHAEIDSSIYESHPSMRQKLQDCLNARFLGVELLTHRPYALSGSSMVKVGTDGRREVFLEVQSGHFSVSTSRVDLRVTDQNGNTILDSKRDRVEQKKRFSFLVSKHLPADGLLASLLGSCHAAVRDPANELVHLYEVREALSKMYGADNAARAALGISSTQWSRLGHLCNESSLRQGRHRGKSVGALRDASEAELTEARNIVLAMVEAYLERLESAACS